MRTASIVRLVCLQNDEQQSRLHYHYLNMQNMHLKKTSGPSPGQPNCSQNEGRDRIDSVDMCGGFVMVTPGFAQQLEGITNHDIIC